MTKRTPGKLGAQARDRSKPAPRLESYILSSDFGATLPDAPARVDRVSAIKSWPMYCNDRLGCCTVASMLHSFEAWEVLAGRPGDSLFSDKEVIKIYSAVSGYDPETGENDNGAQLSDVCNYMVKTGAVDRNGKLHKLAAWAEVEDYTNLPLLKRVLNAFETAYLAIQVPESAMDQFQAGQPWTPVAGSPIEGGHAIPLQFSAVETRSLNDETIVTWGAPQRMNEAFAHENLVEVIAMVSEDQVAAGGTNLAGLAIDQLVTDCQTSYLR